MFVIKTCKYNKQYGKHIYFYAINRLFDLRDQSFTNDGKNWDENNRKMYMSQPALKTKRKVMSGIEKEMNDHVFVSIVVWKLFTF